MKTTITVSMLVATGAALVAAGAAQAAGKCVLAKHQGVGVSADIAKPLALDGLKQSMADTKLTAKGKVTYKCEGGIPLVTCTAMQKACAK